MEFRNEAAGTQWLSNCCGFIGNQYSNAQVQFSYLEEYRVIFLTFENILVTQLYCYYNLNNFFLRIFEKAFLSYIGILPRYVFRNQLNIYDEAFCKNNLVMGF